MTTVHHLACKLDNLLELTDYDLEEMFAGTTVCKNGDEIRRELEIRKAHGDIYIGSDSCEGFHPVTGCPGHKPKNTEHELPIRAIIAIKEIEKKKMETSSFLVSGMAKKAAYQDAINIIREVYKKEMEVSNG